MIKKEILIASSNEGKLREFRTMLEPLGYTVKGLADCGITVDIEETGETYEENALIKAKYLANLTGKMVIADDSGFEVAHLNNEPGLYSARYLGSNTHIDVRIKSIIDRMSGVSQENRSCKFVCVIALIDEALQEYLFRGEMHGYVAEVPRGTNGFAYDPIAVIPKYSKTVAELSDAEKHDISHRGNALKKVLEYLSSTDA